MDVGIGELLELCVSCGGDFFYWFYFELYGVLCIWVCWLICVVIMFMLVVIVSGVIIYKKIFKDFFIFCSGKGQCFWLDSYNVMVVLVLLFYFMIIYLGLLIFMVMLMFWGMNVVYEDGWCGFFQDVFFCDEVVVEGGVVVLMVDIVLLVVCIRVVFDQLVCCISVDWFNWDNVVIWVFMEKVFYIID